MRLLASLLMLVCALPVNAADFYVSRSGSDEASGKTESEAFHTIQRGVNALEPGDTLTIFPGEYREQVYRKGLGEAGKQTVIRARIPGTVLLRGDVPVSGFKPVEGWRGVDVADYEGVLEGVSERDTLQGFSSSPNARELQFCRNRYHYDEGEKKLYVSSSDFRPAAEHRYSVSVSSRHGLLLEEPTGVVIDGIAATGFRSKKEVSNLFSYSTYGVFLLNAKQCVIRNTVAFLNDAGIGIRSGDKGDNVIEDCVAYGNDTMASVEGGNIMIFAPKNDAIRRCIAYRSKRHGLRLYGVLGKDSLIEDSLGWGNGIDIWIKGNNTIGIARRSIALGIGNALQMENCLIGGNNTYVKARETPADSIVLQGKAIDWEKEFADPLNFDFRLLEASRFRAKTSEKQDRGPFPYQASIYYLSPEGDDGADGLSLRTAWKTLKKAAGKLNSGDTLYLKPGTYEGDVVLKGDHLEVRGHGVGTVVLRGKVAVIGGKSISFQRVSFLNPVRIEKSEGLRFENCRFLAKESGLISEQCKEVSVTHCEFTGFKEAGVRLEGSSQVFLASNLFDNTYGPAVMVGEKSPEEAIAYSDYNSYSSPGKVWRIGQTSLSLKEQQEKNDLFSVLREPKYLPDEEGLPELANRAQFFSEGALGKNIGFHQDLLPDTLAIERPRVHSVTETTANIEWKVANMGLTLPGGAILELAWGSTPECLDGKGSYRFNERFGSLVSYSLTGLKPDKAYYFRIRSALNQPEAGGKPRPFTLPAEVMEPVAFTTAARQKAPQTYYVSASGDDQNSGATKESPLRTIQAGADRAAPGDVVMVGGGEYVECVYVRATGEKNHPITFRNVPGERVTLKSGEKQLPMAWVLGAKKHIVIDGFYHGQFAPTGGGSTPRVFNLYQCDDVVITRCLSNQTGPGYTSAFMKIMDSRKVTVSNCVIYGGVDGLFAHGVDELLFEHNVMVRPLTVGTDISVKQGSKAVLRNNIFTDSQPYKAMAGVFYHVWGNWAGIIDENNCYYLTKLDEERRTHWLLNYIKEGSTPAHTQMSITQYQQAPGVPPVEKPSMVANPGFAGLLQKEIVEGPVDRHDTQERKKRELISPIGRIDFDTFFITNPEVKARGIGLETQKFSEFVFPADFQVTKPIP